VTTCHQAHPKISKSSVNPIIHNFLPIKFFLICNNITKSTTKENITSIISAQITGNISRLQSPSSLSRAEEKNMIKAIRSEISKIIKTKVLFL